MVVAPIFVIVLAAAAGCAAYESDAESGVYGSNEIDGNTVNTPIDPAQSRSLPDSGLAQAADHGIDPDLFWANILWRVGPRDAPAPAFVADVILYEIIAGGHPQARKAAERAPAQPQPAAAVPPRVSCPVAERAPAQLQPAAAVPPRVSCPAADRLALTDDSTRDSA
jgi:hypothetical protein